MLPAQNRLTKDRDYETLFAEGRFVGGKLVTAKAWVIEPDKYPRRSYSQTDLKIGFLVSKKIDKRAVVRNRIKRQMREVIRLLLKEDLLKPGVMLAFMAKPEIKGATYQEIEVDLVQLLKRLRAL